MALTKIWLDAGREPQCGPNPDYPTGIDLDASGGATPTCSTTLDYPAKRCGVWFLECSICHLTLGITTAGRPDDPKSIRVPCRRAP